MESMTVILLASGAKKAEIVAKALTEPVSNQLPATILQKHANCVYLLDEAAASRLPDGLGQPLVIQCQLPFAFINDQHPGAVRAQHIQPGTDRVRQTVLRRLINHVHGWCRRTAARHRKPLGQQCRQRQHKGGLAIAGVTLDDGNLSPGQVWLPQPAHLLGVDVAHGEQLELLSHDLILRSRVLEGHIVFGICASH